MQRAASDSTTPRSLPTTAAGEAKSPGDDAIDRDAPVVGHTHPLEAFLDSLKPLPQTIPSEPVKKGLKEKTSTTINTLEHDLTWMIEGKAFTVAQIRAFTKPAYVNQCYTFVLTCQDPSSDRTQEVVFNGHSAAHKTLWNRFQEVSHTCSGSTVEHRWPYTTLYEEQKPTTYWHPGEWERTHRPTYENIHAAVTAAVKADLEKRSKETPLHIMDAGCGSGYLLQALKSAAEETGHTASFSGFDFNKSNVAETLIENPDATVVQADITKLDETHGTAEKAHVVTCSGVLTHQVLEDRDHALKAAEGLYNRLHWGGMLVIAGLAAPYISRKDLERIGFKVVQCSVPNAAWANKYMYVAYKEEDRAREAIPRALPTPSEDPSTLTLNLTNCPVGTDVQHLWEEASFEHTHFNNLNISKKHASTPEVLLTIDTVLSKKPGSITSVQIGPHQAHLIPYLIARDLTVNPIKGERFRYMDVPCGIYLDEASRKTLHRIAEAITVHTSESEEIMIVKKHVRSYLGVHTNNISMLAFLSEELDGNIELVIFRETSEDTFHKYAESFNTRIVTLSLPETMEINDALTASIKNLSSLKELHIRTRINKETLDTILENNPLIEKVSLLYDSSITPEVLSVYREKGKTIDWIID